MESRVKHGHWVSWNQLSNIVPVHEHLPRVMVNILRAVLTC